MIATRQSRRPVRDPGHGPGGLKIGGRTLAITNQQKVLYPETGFTKGELIAYYIEIAPYVLPHLAGRALTLKRYPDGVNGIFFYEKRCPPNRPAWFKTVGVFSERKNEKIEYCVVNDLPSLVWIANLADIELHPSLALARRPNRPTAIAFDLDPGEPAGLIQCAKVALRLRERLATLGLDSLAKTSGSKGMQLYVPLNTPATFEQTKAFSRALAERLASDVPGEVVSNMTRSQRPGKVLIDWSQNDRHKTTICVYSLRAKATPTVSTPLLWDEVESWARRKAQPPQFGHREVLERIRQHGDLFAPVLGLIQNLPGGR